MSKSKNQRSRKVEIHPSPFSKVNLKLVKSEAKVNSAGYAVQDVDGKISTSFEPVQDAVQIPGTSKYIRPAITVKGLNTGLNVVIDNPYKEEDVYIPEWGEKVLKGKEKVLLQHALEYKHGKAKDYYTNQLWDRIIPSNEIAEAPFFLTPQGYVILNGNFTVLDLDNPIHEVWYYILRAHSVCANSYEELDNGKNRTAQYFMSRPNETVNRKIEEERRINKAAAFIESLYNETSDGVIKFAQALGMQDRNPSRDNSYNFLNKYFKLGEIEYNKFMKLANLYEDAARRDVVFGRAMFQDLHNHGVVRTRDGRVYWNKPETDESPAKMYEWSSVEKFVKDFINAPEYQEEVEIIKGILESRKS